MENKIVQGLWVSGRLSAMEKTAINSYLANGHEFHLYTYGNLCGVPYGTVVRDGNEIIEESKLFLVRGGYSSFSDFFRWKLIRDRGGWWTDLDAICLKPFDFQGEYVFVGGLGPVGSDDCVSSGLFRAPAHSPVTEAGWDACQRMNPATMAWGAAGPPLFTQMVHKFGLTSTIVRGSMFFPVFYTNAPEAFISKYAPIFMQDCYSVHLFNEMWRLAGKDKDAKYPKTSLYEHLKERYCERQ